MKTKARKVAVGTPVRAGDLISPPRFQRLFSTAHRRQDQ
jgi:hypothetical protein